MEENNLSGSTVGPVDAIPLRGARTVQTPRREIAVFRTASDEIFALEDKCPHKGGPLDRRHRSRPQGRLPAAQLDHRSGKRRGDRRRTQGCARKFPVKVERGRILLDMGVAAPA